MSLTTENNLTRTLTAGSCKIVGTQIKAHIDDFESKGGKLEPKIKQEADRLAHCTAIVGSFTQDETTMNEIDICTDRAVSGLESNLDGTIKVYNASEMAPLSDTQQQRFTAASLLYAKFFSDGLKFLNLKHRQQWLKLDEIEQSINSPETQGAIHLLGLSPEIERIQLWITRYGQCLGITQAQPNNKTAEAIYQAIEAWHTTLKKLSNQTHANYDDDNNPEHLKLRQMLLSPYDQQADEERKSARAERKTDKTP